MQRTENILASGTIHKKLWHKGAWTSRDLLCARRTANVSRRNPAFGIEMEWGERKFEKARNDTVNHHVSSFFKDFIDDGSFNGTIVVGAPEPHGPYRSSARDGHYATQLAFFLGSFCSLPPNFVVKLDVDANSEKISRTENIISIGGPGTNIITSEFNRYYQFDLMKPFWSGLIAPMEGLIHLTITTNRQIRNPFSEKFKTS